jgi:hypothetical protein
MIHALSQMCMTIYTFQEEWHTFYDISINSSTVGNDTLWEWSEKEVCYIMMKIMLIETYFMTVSMV